MEVVRASLRPIEGLRKLFPGTWKYQGTFWHGEQFDVAKRAGKYYRRDTNEQIEIFPHRKKRSHFIYKILEAELGGTWVRHPNLPRWTSKQHPFFVYRTSETKEGKCRRVCRRSDTAEVVYRCDGRRFYNEKYEKIAKSAGAPSKERTVKSKPQRSRNAR